MFANKTDFGLYRISIIIWILLWVQNDIFEHRTKNLRHLEMMRITYLVEGKGVEGGKLAAGL